MNPFKVQLILTYNVKVLTYNVKCKNIDTNDIKNKK